MNIYEFNRGEELSEIGQRLDRAGEREPIKYLDDGELIEVENRKVIVNETNGTFSQIASDRYEIVQHSDFIDELSKSFGLYDFSRGVVRDYGDSVYVIMKSDEAINPSDDSIDIGFRFGNSFDGSHNLFGEFYGEREVCSNGMMLSDVLSKSYQKHTTNVSELELTSLIEDLEEVKERLDNLVMEAMEDNLTKSISEILENIELGERAREIISRRVPVEASRWELYNAITQFITKSKVGEVEESTLENYHKKASRVLTSSSSELEEEIEQSNLVAIGGGEIEVMD